jgi:hypothetical protein
VTRLLKYSHPWLATILNYWPATVLPPIMLGLIAMLAVVTHFWHHDDEQAREVSQRANGGAAPVGDGADAGTSCQRVVAVKRRSTAALPASGRGSPV